jgi:hypothetical protein
MQWYNGNTEQKLTILERIVLDDISTTGNTLTNCNIYNILLDEIMLACLKLVSIVKMKEMIENSFKNSNSDRKDDIKKFCLQVLHLLIGAIYIFIH